jgi:hypothetical protein
MCRAGAIELNTTAEKIGLDFPGKVKFAGIGNTEKGFDDFKEQGFFKHDLYINKNKTIYKALGYKKPGWLSCFGLCTKNYFKRLNDINNKYKQIGGNNDIVKTDPFQMGGSLLITSKGEVIFQHIDSFYGDHAKETDIMESVTNYYNQIT